MARKDIEVIKTLENKTKLIENEVKLKFDPDDEFDIIACNNDLCKEIDEMTSNIVAGIEEKEQQIELLNDKVASANATLKKLKARGYKLKVSQKLTAKKSWKQRLEERLKES
jgi:hypothetical protein